MPGEVNVALSRLKNKIEKINDALEMNHRLIVLIGAEGALACGLIALSFSSAIRRCYIAAALAISY